MMDASIDTLKRYQRYFKKLIQLEQLEEISFHLNEIHSISGFQREKKGRAILGLSAREYGRGLGGIYLVRLNHEHAVAESLRSRELFLIHGPPGTGKTTTLVEAILQHARKGSKVLATADSNTAVDNVVEKLLSLKTSVLRIGNPARLNSSIISVSIDQQIQDNPDYQQAAALREMTAELREEQKNHMQPTARNRRGLSDAQILTFSRRGGTGRGIPLSKIHRMADWIHTQRIRAILAFYPITGG
ncbi:MAG: AAA family ATPase [Cyclobacteriaceae bacterium]|nr:AAA family ATPase [Cyclobacteriaceae bacterium]